MTTQTTANALESLFGASSSPAEYAGGFFGRMAEVMSQIDHAKLGQIVEAIMRAPAEDKAIYFAGNGGSGAVASHIVNDLTVNNIVEGERGFRAFSLSDNTASITATANDSCFENIFASQLKCSLQEGDLFVALSVSGNSENIIRAVDYANSAGATTIGWCGFDGGRLAEKAQISIVVAATPDEYGPVEDVFSNFGHVLTGYITMKRGRKLSH